MLYSSFLHNRCVIKPGTISSTISRSGRCNLKTIKYLGHCKKSKYARKIDLSKSFAISQKPVARRIQYKMLLLRYKITHRHAPFYLCDLLPSYQPTRCLRSSSSNALVVPRTRGKAGDAAFSVAAPRLWNALPHKLKCVANINIFKNHLKTHLFTF